MFWWWQLVEEESLYPTFAAFSRFMEGEDLRGVDMKACTPRLLQGESPYPDLLSVCLKDGSRGLGWISRHSAFEATDPAGPAGLSDVTLELTGMEDGNYEVAFWDTIRGQPIEAKHAGAKGGTFRMPVPAFARDIAFKIRPKR
jgi:hypothetical protein